jgi:hypothetical protein
LGGDDDDPDEVDADNVVDEHFYDDAFPVIR